MTDPSATFCILPWIHLFVPPTGEVTACCYAEGNAIGDSKTSSLKEIWNSQKMRDFRLALIKGDQPPECRKCVEHELGGSISHRITMNKNYRHLYPRVTATNSDGSLPSMNLAHLDIRFSNLCNFRCRSCSQEYSSSWGPDIHKLSNGALPNRGLIVSGRFPGDLFEQVNESLGSVESIYFAGGEPLLMDEHYQILERLLQVGREDVAISYNTNLSRLKHRGWEIVEFWKRFKNLKIGVSLDGTGKRAEYWRKGQDWKVLTANFDKIREACPNAHLSVGCTLGAVNMLHVPDFHREWIESKRIGVDDFFLNLLVEPGFMCAQVLPGKFKEAVQFKYAAHIQYLKKQDETNSSLAISSFESAVKFMNASDRSSLLPELQKYMMDLDRLRGEDLETAFPELKGLFAHITSMDSAEQ